MYLERANYLVNEIKLGWIKGRAVARAGRGTGRGIGGGITEGRGDNRGTRDDAGIRLANAFISIRRGRVTCPPLRSVSSTSLARSLLLPLLFPRRPCGLSSAFPLAFRSLVISQPPSPSPTSLSPAPFRLLSLRLVFLCGAVWTPARFRFPSVDLFSRGARDVSALPLDAVARVSLKRRRRACP